MNAQRPFPAGRARVRAFRRGAAAWFLALCGSCAAVSAAEVRNPHGVAVIIGNSNYGAGGLPPVDYALRDAQAFERYARDVLGFGGENVIVLKDATEREMRDTLGDPLRPADDRISDLYFALDLDGGSDVVVFYSGHGAPGLYDGEGYLLPVDVPPRDAQRDGYPLAALYDTLEALLDAELAQSVRVYLDACFSGSSAGGSLFPETSVGIPDSVDATPERTAKGMTVLTAGGPKQLAHWDREARHGMFTHHLLDALYGGADKDGDAAVTAREARDYLHRTMSRTVWAIARVTQNASLAPRLEGLGDQGAVLSAAPPGGFPERPEIEIADPPPDDEELELASGGNAADPPPPSPDPAAVEEALDLGFEERKAVQTGLESLVGSVGHADGVFGDRTRAALRRWQEDRGLEPTGYLTREQADALAAKGRDAAEAAEQEREEQARAAREAADRDAFAAARSANTVAAFDEYLRSFPSGRHVDEARRLREEVDDGFAVGDVFRDCPQHCPQMVVVPAGRFTMGSPSEDGYYIDEGPQHEVTIGSKFAVGVYEVTFDEWDACVSGGGCGGYRPDDEGWGRGGRPVINVSWEDARAYAEWLSGETGESYRLLSESEWEYVARAGTVTKFWWGNDIGSNRANCGSDLCGDSYEYTSPVGSFGANAFGLHDVHGNVWEWVEDCWHENYEGAPRDGSVWLGDQGGDCSARVLRGGSWGNVPLKLRSAYRGWSDSGGRGNGLGFRLLRPVRTLAP